MQCVVVHEWLSARMDGEDVDLDRALQLDEHLEGCAGCRDWLGAAESVTRRARLTSASVPPPPDRTTAILAAAAAQGLLGGERSAFERRWRWVLAALGFMQIGVALQALFALPPGQPVHLARELGSWDMALAVGFLFASWRPSRAWGMLPLVAALVGAVVATAVLDIGAGQTRPGDELVHALELGGLAALWLLARGPQVVRPRLRLA